MALSSHSVCASEHGDDIPVDLSWRTFPHGVGRHRYLAARDFIFRQGDPACGVHLLVSGMVKLHKGLSTGHEAIVGIRTPGMLLGATCALSGAPHMISAQTVTPCQTREIPATRFRQLVTEDADISRYVHNSHGRELVESMEDIACLSCMLARDRLVRLLRRIRDHLQPAGPGDDRHLEIPLRDWEIAQLVAISPQWLCGLMHGLAGEGMVAKLGGRWVIVAGEA